MCRITDIHVHSMVVVVTRRGGESPLFLGCEPGNRSQRLTIINPTGILAGINILILVWSV